jgi:hypothetical protein
MAKYLLWADQPSVPGVLLISEVAEQLEQSYMNGERNACLSLKPHKRKYSFRLSNQNATKEIPPIKPMISIRTIQSGVSL